MRSAIDGYVSSLPSISSIGSYVTTAAGQLAQQSSEVIKSSIEQLAQPRRRWVLYKSFEEWQHEGKRYRILVLGLLDGFQLIDITSTRAIRVIAAYSDAPDNNLQLQSTYQQQDETTLLNQAAAASTPIGMIKLLTHPTAFHSNVSTPSNSPGSTPPTTPFYGALLAVCSGEDRSHFPRSLLKIFSLAQNKYVHLMRFKSRIFGIHVHPTSRYMTIALEAEMHVYTIPKDGHSLNFECVWSTRILPNPSPHVLQALQATLASNPSTASLLATSTFSKDEWSVVSLAQRWVAYCPHEPLPPGLEPAALFVDTPLEAPNASNLPSSSSNDSLSTVAKGIASGLYNLGGMGKLAVANYLSGETPTGQNADGQQQQQPVASVLGTVIIRDIPTQRVISCIRAHPNAQITHVVFDRSGTLLATVPVDGQYVHIYQIVMVPEPVNLSTQQVGANAAVVGAASGQTSTDHSPHPQARRFSLSATQTRSPQHHPQPSPPGSQLPPPRYHTRFLYRLFRGVTHATIRDVAFSFDSKFLSVVSSKGTTHIYAINPVLGGDVSVHTHGPQEIADDNSLLQQMVSKYSVLQAQQHSLSVSLGGFGVGSSSSSSSGGGGTGSGLVQSSSSSTLAEAFDAQRALESFLYQPKVLSAIWRIKQSGVPTAWHGGASINTPAYQPVLATFDRLDYAAGVTTQQQQSSSGQQGQPLAHSVPHHLLVSTWNDEITSYALTTSYPLGNVDTLDPEKRPKMALNVDPIATFDLHASLVGNAQNANQQMNQNQQPVQYAPTRPLQQAHQSHPQSSHTHSQQGGNQIDHDDDTPTVRILTTRGQEDEPNLNARSHSPSMRPQAPSFFQQLDAEKLYGRSVSPLPGASSASATAGVAIPRSSLFAANSPIFAAININRPSTHLSAETSPTLAAAQQQAAAGSRWLSQVELRTFQSSDVPLWASPQFQLKTYADPSGAPSSQLFIERAGSKELVYNKFGQFSGMRTDLPEAAAGAAVEDAISAALSSSMLDDAGFMASIRATNSASPSVRQMGERGEIDFDPEMEEGQQSALLGVAGQLDEDFFGRSSGDPTQDSAPSIIRTSPTSARTDASNIYSSNASASDILFAKLPPSTKVEDSLLISPLMETKNRSISPPTVHEGASATKVKKKSKSHSKSKMREIPADEDW